MDITKEIPNDYTDWLIYEIKIGIPTTTYLFITVSQLILFFTVYIVFQVDYVIFIIELQLFQRSKLVIPNNCLFSVAL